MVHSALFRLPERLSPNRMQGRLRREFPDMMSAKSFGSFDPLPPLSAFGSDLYYKIYALN